MELNTNQVVKEIEHMMTSTSITQHIDSLEPDLGNVKFFLSLHKGEEISMTMNLYQQHDDISFLDAFDAIRSAVILLNASGIDVSISAGVIEKE